MKHSNIPIFIPHLGCPNECVFCNQRKITSHTEFCEDDVKTQIEQALSTLEGRECEIAFFGGSFTGIDRGLMLRLLKLGYSYIQSGRVESLRCSTRPDYIDGEILGILREYGMKTVELGIQSTDDSVLRACRRGHTAACALEAMAEVKQAGFTLIGQMMVGLPGADSGSEVQTARDICRYADGARIYPIVIYKQTELCEMVNTGAYAPLSADELLSRTVAVKEEFIKANVPTIRIGLQSNNGLQSGEDIACGTYDCAIGERCESEIYYKRLRSALAGLSGGVTVAVPRGATSKAVGHRGINKTRLISEFALSSLSFAEADLPEYSTIVVTMAEQ